MMYKIGDKIPNGETMLRRIKLCWVDDDLRISPEAFSPKKGEKGHFEDGLSLDVKRLVASPIGNDYWSNVRKMATGQFLSDVVNALSSYDIIYNGPSPSHCIIAGDMVALYYDEDTRALLAENTVIIHVPTE